MLTILQYYDEYHANYQLLYYNIILLHRIYGILKHVHIVIQNFVWVIATLHNCIKSIIVTKKFIYIFTIRAIERIVEKLNICSDELS